MTTFAVPMPAPWGTALGGGPGQAPGPRPGRHAVVPQAEQIGAEEAQQRLADIANTVLHSSMLAASMLPMLPTSVQETAYTQREELDEVVRSLRAVIVDLAESA